MLCAIDGSAQPSIDRAVPSLDWFWVARTDWPSCALSRCFKCPCAHGEGKTELHAWLL